MLENTKKEIPMNELKFICPIEKFGGFETSDDAVAVIDAKKLAEHPLFDTSIGLVLKGVIFRAETYFDGMMSQLLDIYSPKKEVTFLTQNGAFSTNLAYLLEIVKKGLFFAATTSHLQNSPKTANPSSIENYMGSMHLKGESGLEKERYSTSDLIKIIRKLTAPDGCEWDKVQTHDSIMPNLIEEAYEAAAAVMDKSTEDMKEEFGDCLLQTVLNCDIAERSNEFTFNDCVDTLCKKLYTRHTHIFGNDKAATKSDALGFWEKAKEKEKSYFGAKARIEKLPQNLPSLMLSQKSIKAVLKQNPVTKETLIDEIISRLQNLKETTKQIESNTNNKSNNDKIENTTNNKINSPQKIENSKILLLATALYSLDGGDAETDLLRDIHKLKNTLDTDKKFTSIFELLES